MMTPVSPDALEIFRSKRSMSKSKQMAAFQDLAWEAFETKGLPQKNQEAFQYVALRKLYEALHSFETKDSGAFVEREEIASSLLPECKETYLVLKNGKFVPELSKLPSSFVVLPLDEALESPYGTFLKHRMHLQLKEEKDPWALLNSALCDGGVFVYVPPKVHSLPPVQIVHLVTDPSLSYVGPRVHLFVGAQAELKIVTSFSEQTSLPAIYNDFFDVSLEERASLAHAFSASSHSFSWGLSSFRATLKKESRLQSVFTALGCPGLRRDYSVSLLGEGAEADLKGLTALSGLVESHVHVHMEHSAPSCTSHQFFKNVLGAQSRSSFTGKIYVKRAAQKTQAYQLNQNLLLSDQAIANTKPNLEIFADDVKASHGATVAQIDEDQILYLRARGIPLAMAKSLLTMGFCQEILDAVPLLSLRTCLSDTYQSFLLEKGLLHESSSSI